LIIQSPPPMSEFLRIANGVSVDVVANNGPGLRIAREVDDLIRTRLFGTDLDVGISSANMAMASYFSFLGGIRAALSGHVAAVFPMIRHGIECACYAYRFEEDGALIDVWLQRHRGETERQACRKAFGTVVRDVSTSVTAQQEDLGRLIDGLNQASIDFGAHPNPRSIINNLSIDEDRVDGLVGVSLACLCGPEDLRIQTGLIACAETGIASAFVIALAAESHPLLADQYRALADTYARVQEAVAEIQRAAP
jgi:hypothetical protein